MYPLKLFFGGSFDPIHQGHLVTLAELQSDTSASLVSLIPNAISPLKIRQHSQPEQRKVLLELALLDYPQFTLDWREVTRGGASYTIDTLAELAAENPNEAIAFVMGMDSFNQLNKWRNWRKLTDYAHLIVTARPGYHLQLDDDLAAWFAAHNCQQRSQLQQQRNGLISIVEMTPMPISSTELRQLCQQGADASQLKRFLNPQQVAYIQQYKIYK